MRNAKQSHRNYEWEVFNDQQQMHSRQPDEGYTILNVCYKVTVNPRRSEDQFSAVQAIQPNKSEESPIQIRPY